MNHLSRDLQAGHQLISIFETSKVQLDNILDEQPTIFAIIDAEGRILRASREMAARCGKEISECLGLNVDSLFSKETWAIFDFQFKKVKEGENNSVSFELSIAGTTNQRSDNNNEEDGEERAIFWKMEKLRIHNRSDLSLFMLVGQDISALRRTEKQLAEVFASSPVAILSVGSEGTILPSYSAYCETLFDTNQISGASARNLIFSRTEYELNQNQIQALDRIFALFNEPGDEFDKVKKDLPSEFLFASPSQAENTKYLGISYHPIIVGGIIRKYLLILEDKSDRYEIQKMREQNKFLEEESTARILQIKKCRPDLLKILIGELDGAFKTFYQHFNSHNWEEVQLVVHGIKGNAMIMGFKKLGDLCHDFETFITKTSRSEDFNAQALGWRERLKTEWNEIRTLSLVLFKDVFSDLTSAEKGGKDGLTDILNRYQKLQGTSSREIALTKLRMSLALKVLNSTPLADLHEKIVTQVNLVSQNKNKEVKVHCEWNDIRVDLEVWNILSESLVHLINNSIAHGIEMPQVREASRKPKIGTIDVRCSEVDGFLNCEVCDDGKGIDIERIRTVAVQKKIISMTESLSWTQQQLMQVIFQPGFSTATEIDKTSGRGVGLGAVSERVKRFGGEVFVHPRRPFGTMFTLRLPLEQKVLKKSWISLSQFLSLLASEFFVLKRSYGIEITLSNHHFFETKDNFVFCDPEQLLLSLSSLLAVRASTHDLRISIRQSADKVVLDVTTVRSRPKVKLPHEFELVVNGCTNILFGHQGELTQRNLELSISFGHVLSDEQLPIVQFEPDTSVELEKPEQLKLTLMQLNEIAAHFRIRTAKSPLDIVAEKIRLVSSHSENPHHGNSEININGDKIKDQFVQAIGYLLK